MDIIDKVATLLPKAIEKRKPLDAEAAYKEDLVDHAMFEYYARLYEEYPEWTRTQYLSNVASKFARSIEDVEFMYTKFRWFSRAKKLVFEGKSLSCMPGDGADAMQQMLVNTDLIASLGSRFVNEYLKNVNPELMTPKDVYKIGMLVVECVRVRNEVMGGSDPKQAQGQVINLVINE